MFVGTEVGLADANTTIPETDRHSRTKGLMLIEILKYVTFLLRVLIKMPQHYR